MKGLIIKDFLNLKRHMLPMVLFLIIYFIISLTTKNSSFFTGVIMVFCAMLPITALSYDDRSAFTKYALTMPVSRNALVISKYVMSLILLATGTILGILNNIFIGNLSFFENLLSVVITMLMGCLMISISLPAIFKFGVEKGRFVMLGIVMIIVFIGGFGAMGIGNGKFSMSISKNGFSLGSTIDSFFSSNFIFALILAFCTIIFLLSMLLSISIYQKKDF